MVRRPAWTLAFILGGFLGSPAAPDDGPPPPQVDERAEGARPRRGAETRSEEGYQPDDSRRPRR